ncbi:hypothetical protein [Pseudomonas sp. NPDC089547]|uniref:hypothetical protein n=1 Tax=Pseudomonas sp. NPDC089547 TaxID=3390652 RepID=UPI003D042B86
MKDKVEGIIFAAVDGLSHVLAQPVDCSAGAATALFGVEGQLDSMSLVSLIVSVEEAVEAAFGVTVVLASEKAMSARRSPFTSVASLTEHVMALVGEQAHA